MTRSRPSLTALLRALGRHRREGPCGVFMGANVFDGISPRFLTQKERLAAREAHERGLRLLKQNLSPAQRSQWEEHGYFEVVGGETGRRYRIRTGSQMNIEQLNKKGRAVRLLCFVPAGELVMGDVMLAQKLALELFEKDALKVANEFPVDFA